MNAGLDPDPRELEHDGTSSILHLPRVRAISLVLCERLAWRDFNVRHFFAVEVDPVHL